MQLRISNLAWDHAEEFYALVEEQHVSALELAPTKVWPKLEEVTEGQCRHFLESLSPRGVCPVAFQALLFGCPQLQLFQAPEECLKRLGVVMQVAKWLGVRILVFGSPKNRLLTPGGREEVLSVLERAGNLAKEYGCLFCVEPNPPLYGGNWALGLADTAAVLRELNHSSVRLHADTGAMLANGEKVTQLEETFDLLASCHISLPGLKPLTQATGEQLQLMKNVVHALRGAPHLHSLGLEMMRAESLEELKRNLTIFTGLAA